jgi:hypothetical protein
MALKVKRLAVDNDPPHEDPAELTAKLSNAVAHLPTTRPPLQPVSPQPIAAPVVKEKTVLVNFRASRQLAKAVQQVSAEHGGTRRWLAKLLYERGYQIPAEELAPPPPSRRSYD